MSRKSHCDDLFMIIDRFYFYQKCLEHLYKQ